jgi:hypothetical protein
MFRLDTVNISAGVVGPKLGPTNQDEALVCFGPEKRASYHTN